MPNRLLLHAFSLAMPVFSFFPGASFAAAGADFSGAWTGWSCPAGVRPSSGKCASFVLSLYQKEDQVCGSHLYATAGASSLDEGGMPSFTGTIANDVVEGVVASGRSPGTRLRVELKMSGDRMQWRRLENPDADYLLPDAMQLVKAKRGKMFHPVFEQRLSATCMATLNRALEEKQHRTQRPPQPQQANPRPTS